MTAHVHSTGGLVVPRVGPACAADAALVEAHVAAMRRAGLETIAVVWPAGAGALPPGCGDVRVVLETRPGAGPFDEIVTGLFALERAPALVMPVTHGLVSVETIAMLADEVRDYPLASAIVPRFRGRSGYPVALTRPGIDRLVRDAAAADGRHDLDVLLASWFGVRTLEVVDRSVLDWADAPSSLASAR